MTQRYTHIAVLLAIVVAWFALLGYRDLIDPDEGRYAEIPREMLVSGDWITPRLNGLKYFEKPPLQYWATAAFYKLLGFSNASARLWIVLIGFVGAVWVFFVASRLFGVSAGYYAFALGSSSALYVVCSHYLTLDITVSVFLAVGIGAFALAQNARDIPRSNRHWMLLAWAAFAAAVLSKGLIGIVLPGGAIVVYSLWQKDWNLYRHLHLGKGLTLFLLLVLPWFIAVQLRNQEFFNFFFIHEHLQRYLTPVHGHDEPAYYFLLVLLLGFCPWIITSLTSIARPSFPWRVSSAANTFCAERFLWVFVVFVVAFFSFSHSKIGPYILPAMPIVAILAGKRMAQSQTYSGEGWVMLVCSLIVAIIGAAAPIIGDNFASHQQLLAYQKWIIVSAMLLALGSTILLSGRIRPNMAVLSAGLCTLVALQLLLNGYQSLSSHRSARLIADEIMQRDPNNKNPIYMVRTYSPSLPFYLQRLVTLAAYRGELGPGIDAEPQKVLMTTDGFAAQWSSPQKAFAVINNDVIADYRHLGIPMLTLYQGSELSLVTNSGTDPENSFTVAASLSSLAANVIQPSLGNQP